MSLTNFAGASHHVEAPSLAAAAVVLPRAATAAAVIRFRRVVEARRRRSWVRRCLDDGGGGEGGPGFSQIYGIDWRAICMPQGISICHATPFCPKI